MKKQPIEQPKLEETAEIKPDVIDNLEEFRMAVALAQMGDVESFEVSERLFLKLCKSSTSPYLTYGDPGVKVFKAGTRDEIEKLENMHFEAHHEFVSRKKAQLS